MDYKISHIQIAGAGAGKTYGLASQLIKRDKVAQNNKTIFAITYTNAAKSNIIKRIKEQVGSIPENIRVMTVHSFLLEMIVFPYSNFILGQSFKKAVSIPLSNNPKYKGYKLKQLNEQHIIHNIQVFKKSQMILNKKNKKKSLQSKIEIVLKHVSASIDSIFIDEAQDLDDDALEAFRILSEHSIYNYMVGDPKQALRYPKSFDMFCNKVKTGDISSFLLLNNNNFSRRVPEAHLKISNIFCKKDQRQKSFNDNIGRLSYIFVDSKAFYDLYITCKNTESLIYINKKNEKFDTHIINNKIYLPVSVVEKLKGNCDHQILDFEVWIESIIIEMENRILKMNPREVLSLFMNKYKIDLEKNEWAELYEILTVDKSKRTYHVSSIDKIKGLEASTCVFIIDNVMIQYLTRKKKTRNKEMNKLYVALTRSLSHLIFAVDIERITCMTKSEIKDWFMSKSIKIIDTN